MAIGAAGDAAFNRGLDNYQRLLNLSKMRAQSAGQGDFLNYILNQDTPTPPTAMNPPPGQPSTASPQGGVPPGGAEGPAAGGGQPSFMPPSLRDMLLAIKKNNPGASPQEVMAALQTAEPFMDAQQQQALALMKQQLQVYKTEADESYKQGSLADRQKRTDAYVKHLKDLQAKGDPRAITAEGMKILAGIRQVQTHLSQIKSLLASGMRPDGITALTPDEKKILGEAVDKLNKSISNSQEFYKTFMSVRAGAYGQQFEQANPPPEEPNVPDTTGGGSGGGQ